MNKLLSTTFGKINTKIAGKKGKPVIVLVHGVMASLEYFDELIINLSFN